MEDAQKEGENDARGWHAPHVAQVVAAMRCPAASPAETKRRKDGRKATGPDSGVSQPRAESR